MNLLDKPRRLKPSRLHVGIKSPTHVFKKSPKPRNAKADIYSKMSSSCIAAWHPVRSASPPSSPELAAPEQCRGHPRGLAHQKHSWEPRGGFAHAEVCAQTDARARAPCFPGEKPTPKKPLSSLCVKSPFIKASVAKELPLFQSPVSASLKIFPAQSRL